MTARPATKRTKRPSRPTYAIWRPVIDRETGEEYLALRASTRWDQAACKARGYRVNDEVRLEIKKPRNAKFHALAHALGALLVQNVPGFETMDGHSALKRIQRECGVHCEESTVEVPGVGQLALKVPRSIAFDSLDEGEFTELWDACCKWITQKYWPQLDPSAIEEMVEMMHGSDI